MARRPRGVRLMPTPEQSQALDFAIKLLTEHEKSRRELAAFFARHALDAIGPCMAADADEAARHREVLEEMRGPAVPPLLRLMEMVA